MIDQFEGAETFEALHAAAEQIVRDELVRVGIEEGGTEFRADENSGDEIGVPFISVSLKWTEPLTAKGPPRIDVGRAL